MPNSSIASGLEQDDATDVLPLRADARLLAGRLQRGRSLSYEIDAGHDLYLVPSTGTIRVGGIGVEAGDRLAVINETTVEFTAVQDSELVIVEVA